MASSAVVDCVQSILCSSWARVSSRSWSFISNVNCAGVCMLVSQNVDVDVDVDVY